MDAIMTTDGCVGNFETVHFCISWQIFHGTQTSHPPLSCSDKKYPEIPLCKILTIKGSHFIFLNLLWSFTYLRNLIRSLQILTSNIQFFHQTLYQVFVFFFTLLKTWLPKVTLPGDPRSPMGQFGFGQKFGPSEFGFFLLLEMVPAVFFGLLEIEDVDALEQKDGNKNMHPKIDLRGSKRYIYILYVYKIIKI